MQCFQWEEIERLALEVASKSSISGFTGVNDKTIVTFILITHHTSSQSHHRFSVVMASRQKQAQLLRFQDIWRNTLDNSHVPKAM